MEQGNRFTPSAFLTRMRSNFNSFTSEVRREGFLRTMVRAANSFTLPDTLTVLGAGILIAGIILTPFSLPVGLGVMALGVAVLGGALISYRCGQRCGSFDFTSDQQSSPNEPGETNQGFELDEDAAQRMPSPVPSQSDIQQRGNSDSSAEESNEPSSTRELEESEK